MGLIGRFMSATAAGYSAFRSEMFSLGPRPARSTNSAYASWSAKRHRCDIWWSFFDGSAYRNTHPWSPQFRATYGIYPGTRAIANPVTRLVEFYVGHLLGGDLDPAAGDGSTATSCLPIILGKDASPDLRKAIARLWQDSQFGEMKDRISLYGSIEAEVGLKVVDDPIGRKMRLEIVSATDIADVAYNPTGTVVRGYDLRQMVDDPAAPRNPESPPPQVEFRETVTRTSTGLRYQTFKDGVAYPWNGKESTFDKAIPFIPFLVIKHRDIGKGRSVNCFHNLLPKIVEVDSQTSILSDANRKALRMPMFFAGVEPSDIWSSKEDPRDRFADMRDSEILAARGHAPRPDDEGDEVESFATPNVGATATHMRYGIDAAGSRLHIDGLAAELIRDLPELRSDPSGLAGTPTAEAIRSARSEASSRVIARRTNYYAAIIRAQQMAVAIGGERGYEGYEGFNFESYAAHKLDHSIGKVPVFDVTEDDRIDQGARRAAQFKTLTDGGQVPWDEALLLSGFPEDVVDRIRVSKAAADKAAIAAANSSQAALFSAGE